MNIIELLEKDVVIAEAQKDFSNVIDLFPKPFNTYALEGLATHGKFYTERVIVRLDRIFSMCNIPKEEATYIGFQFYWDEEKHVGVHKTVSANKRVDDICFDWLGRSGVPWADSVYAKVMSDAQEEL